MEEDDWVFFLNEFDDNKKLVKKEVYGRLYDIMRISEDAANELCELISGVKMSKIMYWLAYNYPQEYIDYPKKEKDLKDCS